jgi:hypothetical protein
MLNDCEAKEYEETRRAHRFPYQLRPIVRASDGEVERNEGILGDLGTRAYSPICYSNLILRSCRVWRQMLRAVAEGNRLENLLVAVTAWVVRGFVEGAGGRVL